MQFRIGDRVEVVAPEDNYPTVGLRGTIVWSNSDYDMVGVQHDEKFRGGHTCTKHNKKFSESGKGLWYYSPAHQLKHCGLEFRTDIDLEDIL